MNVPELMAIRKGSAPFRDDVNFPRGISRYGVFSISQSEILKIYGETLRSLEIGILAPINEAERSFLNCCVGMKEPESTLEKIWHKYKREIYRAKSFHTAFGSCKKENEYTEYEVDECIETELH